MTPDDQDLREAFARLKHDEAEAASPLAGVLARARSSEGSRFDRRWVLAAVAVAGMVLLAIRLVPAPVEHAANGAADRTLGDEVLAFTWYTSTDVLLEPHGIELLRTVPWQEDEEEEPELSGNPRPTSRAAWRMYT
jgi:hypothetical protein